MVILPTFDPGFSTPEMTAVFSAENRVRKMLDFEAALADAVSAAGLVDNELAAEIVVACATPTENPESILEAGWECGTPLIPLLAEIRGRISPEAGEWLHYGATSQDAIDTGLMLQVRDGLDILGHGMKAVATRLHELTIRHRATPMMARTFLRHAAPTVFGLETARWLEPVIRHNAEFESANELLALQLGGPTGNLATFGSRALIVSEGVATRLGLSVAVVPWHTDRSRVSSLVGMVERLARSMAKIAVDIALLSQSEIGEIRVRGGGSSSLPGKANPIDAVRALAAAEICSGAARAVAGARPLELDRAIGGWHSEWVAVPIVFQTAAATVAAIDRCLQSLEVDGSRMRANLGEALGLPDLVAPDALIDRVLDAYTGWSEAKPWFRSPGKH